MKFKKIKNEISQQTHTSPLNLLINLSLKNIKYHWIISKYHTLAANFLFITEIYSSLSENFMIFLD